MGAEERVVVAEHQSEKYFRDNSTAHWAELRCGNRGGFLNRDLHLHLMIHGFRQDVSPERAVVLEDRGSLVDADDRRILGILFVYTFADQDVFVVHGSDSHGMCDVLAGWKSHLPTADEIPNRKGCWRRPNDGW